MSHHTIDYIQRIRDSGHRMTTQRQIVLDAVCSFNRHVTAVEILERVYELAPAINQATVYRTLNFLTEIHLLFSGTIDGQTIYEIATETPHHHLICRKCGHIAALPDQCFADLIQQIKVEYKFLPEIDHWAITGLCAACQ